MGGGGGVAREKLIVAQVFVWLGDRRVADQHKTSGCENGIAHFRNPDALASLLRRGADHSPAEKTIPYFQPLSIGSRGAFLCAGQIVLLMKFVHKVGSGLASLFGQCYGAGACDDLPPVDGAMPSHSLCSETIKQEQSP